MAWGFFIPIGIYIARFEKRHDPTWFTAHQYVQSGGVVTTTIGFILSVNYVDYIQGAHFTYSHSIMGLSVFIGAWIQFFLGVFRAHKDTPNRWIWEIVHRSLGRCLLILAVANIFFGIFFICLFVFILSSFVFILNN